jgi:hypothetical protein
MYDLDFLNKELYEKIRNVAHQNFLDMSKMKYDDETFLSRVYANATFSGLVYEDFKITIEKDGKKFIIEKGKGCIKE